MPQLVGLAAGSVAFVTGAASGIGRAAAVEFALYGAKVACVDIDGAGGQETCNRIGRAGGEALFIRCDVSRAPDVEQAVKGTVEAFGRLDFAFNNAGTEGIPASTVDCTEANWDRVLAFNLKGIWLCMKHQIPQMLRQGGGAVVNCSSAAGLVGCPGIPAYVASKHGVIGLTRTAALARVEQ